MSTCSIFHFVTHLGTFHLLVCLLSVCGHKQIEPPVAKEMIKGQSDSLNSSFHLGYNMLLNLLRVEEAGM
jgi:hypothetical protein